MSYERLNLKNDDVLDETHLKHIEDGISEINRWQLLNTIETTEEIAVNPGIVLTEADDGTPYNHKELAIKWYCPIASASSYVSFQVNGKKRNDESGDYFGSGAVINNQERRVMIAIQALGDAMRLSISAPFSVYGSTDATKSETEAMYLYPGECETITSLQLSCYGNIVYPVGLKIKIWGRSA